uniref:C2H2-type domain-containing protein n=1 Tax=Macrostomum lignano TaxID=282301 RepID=A0A1I8GK54_9PLAT
DDLVILSPPTARKGFQGHLLISPERVKKEPAVQIGMAPRHRIGSSCRRPQAQPGSADPGPGLYYRTVNHREQQLDPQPHQQLQQQQQQAAKSSLIQSGMPGPPTAQLPGQPASSFVINSQSGAPRVDQTAPVLLDSRLILSHVSPLENHDSHQLLNQIKYPHEPSAIIKCIECCDQFYFRHCYQHHRERQVVSITYNCEICNRKLAFYNKCALFAHVRTHKLGSVDPSKLTICSLPLPKLKTLSEVSLKQGVSQLEQAHAKYQEALKALNACLPPGSQQHQQQLLQQVGQLGANLNLTGAGASTAAASASATTASAATSTAAATAGLPGTSSGSAVVPITIDLEEGSGAGGGSDSAANSVAGDVAATVATDMSAASTASGAAGQEAKDSRPTAVVEPAVLQSLVVFGQGDAAPAEAAASSASTIPRPRQQQTCGVCGGSFDSLAVHLGDSLKECPLCKKFVPDSRCALRAHFRLHLSAPGPCPECGEEVAPATATQLEREVAMRVHLRSQCLHLQRSKVFICLKCEYPPRAFSALRQLADHIIHSHTEKFFKCTVCTLAFRHTNQLAAHLEKEHNSQLTGKPAKIFKCPICDLIFNDSSNLGKHLLTHLPHQLFCKSAMAFRCLDSCRQIFLEKKGLKRHLNTCRSTVVTDANLPCVLCEINVSFFNNVAELRSHEETHLNQTAGGWCPNCETEVPANLLDHLRQEQKAKDIKEGRIQEEQQKQEKPQKQQQQVQEPKQQKPDAKQSEQQQQQQVKVTCHCGREMSGASEVANVLYRCRDCPTQLPCTELTEHIFAQHPGLCYLCNSAQRSSAHLLACLLAGARMEGSQLDDDAGASSEGSVGGAKPAARSGFKRPAEREQQQQREQQKPEPAKIARVSSSAAAEESASPPASASAATATSSGLACGECGMRFLTKSALQVHRVATRHD